MNELKDTGRYLRVIHEFAVTLLQRSTLDDIFWLIADKAIAELGFDDCVIYLKHETEDVLIQKAAYGPKNSSGRLIKDPITIPIGQGIVGSTALHQRPERISDTRLDSRYILDDAFRLSELAVPIVVEGRCIGVIDSEHGDAGFYTAQHEEILTTIASMAAVKISDAIRTAELGSTVTKLEIAQQTLAQQTKELRQARDQAERANEAKSEFLATMSHEIRTPLNAIVGMASLMADMGLSADALEAVTIVSDSSQHLLALITEILDFSKIEANEMTLVETEIELQSFLASVLSVCTSAHRSKTVAVHLDVGSTAPAQIIGDAVRLRQILVNLIENALKFTPQGKVNVQVHSPTGPDGARCLQIAVRDTGIGISPENLESIFTPFQQVDSSHSRAYGGTGLGLSIAKKLSHLMGGNITASSGLGEGSEFILTIPYKPAPTRPSRPGQSAECGTGDSLSTLVVEDNRMNQRVILWILKHGGYTADLAVNGAEAVTAVLNARYDVVLMDLQMPVMDGFEAIRQIRAMTDIHQPKILVVSGNVQPEDINRAKTAGADDFVAKPIDRKHLIGLLDKLKTVGQPTT